MSSLPIVDLENDPDCARSIARACRDVGFFYVVGHGVPAQLLERLEAVSREFFARDEPRKLEIAMERGGRAWRGYFPVGGELTDGKPDRKEGLYLGPELPNDHPRVRAGTPFFGANLFPDVEGFRDAVLDYMGALANLGHRIVSELAVGLGLDSQFFRERYTDDPILLFRIFNYPPIPDDRRDEEWSVAEHTDYGLLTILAQDTAGGLEVKARSGWVPAPPVEGSFVCNIGDMLDRMTGGFYRSTPHRVRNTGAADRLSFPFFFDPSFDAEIHPIDPGAAIVDDARDRWDRASVHEFEGTYGEYLLGKVSRVFPRLGEDVL